MEFVSKPLIGFGLGYAVDSLYFQRPMNQNLYFATSIGLGLALADVIGKYAIPHNAGRTLETRVLEVALATGMVSAIDSYVLEPQRFRNDIGSRTLAIVGIEIVANYIDDMVMNKSVV